MITAFLVIVILVFLIVAHEFGHFIAAKIFGVRVEEFGVGYPPRAFLLGKIRDTEYTLNWIPFGGFVRLYGEDEGAERGRGSFVDSAWWKQAIILIAGVAVNALVAWLLLAGALHNGIPRVVDTSDQYGPVQLVISDIVPGSPADAAGITPGDQVVGMTDDKGVSLDTLTPDAVVDYVRSRNGESIFITYVHAQATTTVSVIPANAVIPGEAAQPALGIGLVLVSNIALPWSEALKEGFVNTVNVFETVVVSLWGIIDTALHGAPDLSGVVGPVGLVSVVSQAAQSGVGQVLALAGFIAVNLAVINLIPIPALDGGRLAIVFFEALLRRKAPKLAIQLLNTFGIALIILLMVTVTYHDILRLLV